MVSVEDIESKTDEVMDFINNDDITIVGFKRFLKATAQLADMTRNYWEEEQDDHNLL